MSDLSIIFITANQHPKGWTDFHRKVLDKAAEGHRLIVVSREPGGDIHDTEPKSHTNMYKQLLRACYLADTPYIATAEDDALYPPEHYNFYRPPMDTIAYDMCRWSLYWWTPIYSVKQRISNCTLIAPRLEYIDALEERLAIYNEDNKHYHGEIGRYENSLGIKPRKITTKMYCSVPTIHFNSPNGTDPLTQKPRKRLGELKAYDIPYWGKAEDIIKEYK